MQETTERFRGLATMSCVVGDRAVTKNDSLFHRSFDRPSCAVECSTLECFVMLLNIEFAEIVKCQNF
jgi:hypothetical protein